MRDRRFFQWAVLSLSLLLWPLGQLRADSTTLTADEKAAVEAASRHNPPWHGPRQGPMAQTGKRIAVVAEDLRNGGILGVAGGLNEASAVLEWHLKIYDAGGTPDGRRKALANALSAKPDGVVLIGSDAASLQVELGKFAREGTPIVGWHIGPVAGVLKDSPVQVNVSTDPITVAKITALAAIADSDGKAGVVIFTDSNFEIAMAKAKIMAETVSACGTCTLLEVKDVPISKSHELMAQTTRDLMARYGSRWTHALAINDIYFDYLVPELIKEQARNDRLRLLSAGDGSPAAFQRIMTGSFQTGTVAEPLNLHGWQLADELNRLLARQPANGYVVPVHLVTPQNVAFDGGASFQFDPDNGYREYFRKIWKS